MTATSIARYSNFHKYLMKRLSRSHRMMEEVKGGLQKKSQGSDSVPVDLLKMNAKDVVAETSSTLGSMFAMRKRRSGRHWMMEKVKDQGSREKAQGSDRVPADSWEVKSKEQGSKKVTKQTR